MQTAPLIEAPRPAKKIEHFIFVTDGAAAPSRAQIDRLEQFMLAMPQLDLPTKHHLAGGLYARELRIPAGSLLTGRVHRMEHINIVSKGRITAWTEDGMRTVSAGEHLVSRPGTKRVGLTHEDTVWTTIHANPNNLTDIAELEALIGEPASALLAPSMLQLEALEQVWDS